MTGEYLHIPYDSHVFEHYPPHRILKMKCNAPISTEYVDTVRGT